MIGYLWGRHQSIRSTNSTLFLDAIETVRCVRRNKRNRTPRDYLSLKNRKGTIKQIVPPIFYTKECLHIAMGYE